jgi:hypothetical protein
VLQGVRRREEKRVWSDDDFFGGDKKAEFKARCDTNGTTPSVVSSFSAIKESVAFLERRRTR